MWNHSTFSAKRERLFSGAPPSDGGRNATADFKGEKHSKKTHQSTTDPDARLYKKGDGNKSRLFYLGHALMEHSNGLVVDATTTLATGTAERGAALIMVGRSIKKARATLGTDKDYNAAAFVEELRGLGVTPHVAQKKHSAIDGRTTRHAAYAVSIKKRKLAEEIFDLNRTIGGLRKARFVGLAKVRTQTVSAPRTTVCSASGHAAVRTRLPHRLRGGRPRHARSRIQCRLPGLLPFKLKRQACGNCDHPTRLWFMERLRSVCTERLFYVCERLTKQLA